MKLSRWVGFGSAAILVCGLTGSTLISATGHTVNASSLNVRSGPGYGYSVIGTLSKGTVVNTVSTSGSWTKINSPKTGWVYSAYLSNTSHTGSTGTSNLGPTSAAGFVRLPTSGTGFYWYCPYSTHHWGVPRLVSGTITMGRKWAAAYGKRFTCGDMSLTNGGYFPPHSTHRDGRAEDFQPITTSGNGGQTQVGAWNYSTTWNQRFVSMMYSTFSVSFILHNNSRISGVQYSSGHHNHLHLYVR